MARRFGGRFDPRCVGPIPKRPFGRRFPVLPRPRGPRERRGHPSAVPVLQPLRRELQHPAALRLSHHLDDHSQHGGHQRGFDARHDRIVLPVRDPDVALRFVCRKCGQGLLGRRPRDRVEDQRSGRTAPHQVVPIQDSSARVPASVQWHQRLPFHPLHADVHARLERACDPSFRAHRIGAWRMAPLRTKLGRLARAGSGRSHGHAVCPVGREPGRKRGATACALRDSPRDQPGNRPLQLEPAPFERAVARFGRVWLGRRRRSGRLPQHQLRHADVRASQDVCPRRSWKTGRSAQRGRRQRLCAVGKRLRPELLRVRDSAEAHAD